MELFAHNGIDHANTAEAAAHSAGDVITIIAAVAVIVTLAFASTMLFRKFSADRLLIRKNKEK